MNICNTLNGRIKIGDKVYRVAGGGGGINFAIIQVGYPENDKKPTITGTNFRATAPDTSGLWLCGVPVADTYTISYEGLPSQTVTITTKGQVETIVIGSQAVNYQMLYYLGDECTDVTGGWQVQIFGNGSVSKESNHLQYNAITVNFNHHAEFNTINKIDFSSYSKIGCYWRTLFNLSGDPQAYIQSIVVIDPIYRNMNRYDTNIINSGGGIGYYSLALDVPNFVLGDISSSTTFNKYVELGFGLHRTVSMYSAFFVKQDDISSLSEYGTTITEIIDNASSLFDNRTDLQKMVFNCTGDFMITALNNQSFVNIMNASENKDILQANEHWSKFIALLAV